MEGANHMNKKTLPINLQYFAEGAAGESGTQGTGTVESGAQQSQSAKGQQSQQEPTPPQVNIDYDKLAQVVAGKQAATEESVIKGFLKNQGLTKEQMEEAIATFKEKQAAATPDIGALQNELQTAHARELQANVEKEAMFLAGEIGVELKTMPYILKLADLSKVADENGINKETLKESLNKVLEELPELKPQQEQQSGFRQIGAGGDSNQQGQQTQTQQVPKKRWNRYN